MSIEQPKMQETSEDQDKNLKLEEIRQEVENIGDRIGRPIDEGIRETVAMFKANELPTSDSCEGHVERGLPVPYVEVSAPNEPQERFVGQNEVFEKVAKKYNITPEEAKTSKIDEAYWEAMKECSQNEETEEYKKWNEENEKLLAKGQGLLEEFYKERQVEPNVKLQIEEGVGTYRIHNGGEDYQPIIEEEQEYSDEEKKVRSEKLEKYRSEMKEFTEFLREKYLEDNININKIMKNPWEKQLNNKQEGHQEHQAESIAESEFKEKTNKMMDDTLISNIKDPSFDLENPEDKEWYDGIIGAKNMLQGGLYVEPRFFVGPDGARVPKSFETPEGFLKERLSRYEEDIEINKKKPGYLTDTMEKRNLEQIKELNSLLKFIENKKV